jgi:hypothetical protein
MLLAQLAVEQGAPSMQRRNERMRARCLRFVLIITTVIAESNDDSSPVVADVGY